MNIVQAGHVYSRAWDLLREGLRAKTSWGRNEISALMAECLEKALRENT